MLPLVHVSVVVTGFLAIIFDQAILLEEHAIFNKFVEVSYTLDICSYIIIIPLGSSCIKLCTQSQLHCLSTH